MNINRYLNRSLGKKKNLILIISTHIIDISRYTVLETESIGSVVDSFIDSVIKYIKKNITHSKTTSVASSATECFVYLSYNVCDYQLSSYFETTYDENISSNDVYDNIMTRILKQLKGD